MTLTSTNAVPNPGSDEAVIRGCTCPVLDNGHGRGYGRGTRTAYRADNDPLAFWLGVESILQLIADANLRPLGDGE